MAEKTSSLTKPLNHIAFIMDGNGRWAKKRMLPRSAGHLAGVKRIKDIISICFEEYSIYCASLFCFSTENWNRPEKEVSTLFSLLQDFFDKELPYFLKTKTQIRVLGNLSDPRIPDDILKTISQAVDKTKDNENHIFNVLFNYGGRYDIQQAICALSEEARAGKIDPKQITQQDIASHLLTKDCPEVDLLIRTSGEQRISDCFLYQLAYSELVFTGVAWPDFDHKALDECLREYSFRNRRFGAIKE